MPNYDYYCPANGQTIEVLHGMSEQLKTWGEVCERAEIAAAGTSPETPVERKMGAGTVLASSGGSDPDPMPPGGCGSGCCCHPN